jgi:hypothetical protein
VSELLPENRSILHSVFSKEPIDGIFPGDSFFIGEGTLDPGTLRVADLFSDYFGFLPKNVSGGTHA